MPDAYACFTAEAGDLPALIRDVRDVESVESVYAVTGEYDAVAHLDLNDPPVDTLDVLHREIDEPRRDDLPERVVDAIEGVEGVHSVELTFAFEP